MIEAVWIATVCLTGIALLDTQAWRLLAVMWLVVIQMALSEAMIDERMGEYWRSYEVAMKVPVDLVCGWMACKVTGHHRWQKIVPALFVVSLLAHSAYWLAWFNGMDLWFVYPHVLNVLWVLAMMSLAFPGGGRLVGHVRSWASRVVDERGRWSGVPAGETEARNGTRNQGAALHPCSAVYLPLNKRT